MTTETKPKIENERKFKVAFLPNRLDEIKKTEIIQGYMAIDPNGTELRLRSARRNAWIGKKTVYTQTGKAGNDPQKRPEPEQRVPKSFLIHSGG